MAFCRNCGATVDDNAKFCPGCGAETAAPAAQAPGGSYTPPIVPGAPAQSSIQDAQDNKTMAILAYIFFFVPLIAGAHKTSPFVKYHTNQGTVLFITSAIWGVAYGILSSILIFALWGVGVVISTILSLTGLVFLALIIMGILNVVNGKMKPLPVIGKFVIFK